MTRQRAAKFLTGLSAFGFFLAAGLHTSGYGSVVLLAQQGPPGLASLVSALWLAFTAGLILFGLVVTLVALGRIPRSRMILILPSCFPLATAVLQVQFLGFIPPVAILSTIAALGIAGALVSPRATQPAFVGAA